MFVCIIKKDKTNTYVHRYLYSLNMCAYGAKRHNESLNFNPKVKFLIDPCNYLT